MRSQSSVKCLLSGWVSDRSIYQRLHNILIKLYSLQIDMKNDIFFKSVDHTPSSSKNAATNTIMTLGITTLSIVDAVVTVSINNILNNVFSLGIK